MKNTSANMEKEIIKAAALVYERFEKEGLLGSEEETVAILRSLVSKVHEEGEKELARAATLTTREHSREQAGWPQRDLVIRDRPGVLTTDFMHQCFESAIKSTPHFKNSASLNYVKSQGTFFSHYVDDAVDKLWLGFAIGMRCAERLLKAGEFPGSGDSYNGQIASLRSEVPRLLELAKYVIEATNAENINDFRVQLSHQARRCLDESGQSPDLKNRTGIGVDGEAESKPVLAKAKQATGKEQKDSANAGNPAHTDAANRGDR